MQIERVRQDQKGEVWRMTHDSTKVTILYNRAGKYSGGHSHNIETVQLVIHGAVEARTMEGDKETTKTYRVGEAIIQKPGIPLMTRALEDAIIVEYRPGVKADTVTTTPYAPYDEIIKQQSSS
jgi:hypothetical protein